MTWFEQPAVRWLVPLPLLAALAPLVWWAFRGTWRRLDDEALALRQDLAARGRLDVRPWLAFALAAFLLAVQEYHCRSVFFDAEVLPWLRTKITSDTLTTYKELAGRSWWGLTRAVTYTLPLLIWPWLFRDERARDLGLRVRGFFAHAWIYASFVVVMVPVLAIAAMRPDFGRYYPIYKLAGRSWTDFLIWQAVYLAQFLGLEIFFRGWWLRATRSLGAAAIFAMAVPYAMIHFQKPYLEACGAIVAGVILGSLAAHTRAIWSGFLVHATVAVLMDLFALSRRGELPRALQPGSSRVLVFDAVGLLAAAVWLTALAVVIVSAWQHRAVLAAWWHRARR
jgi:hypothetical protein